MLRLIFGFIISCFISINIFATSAADEFVALLNNMCTMSADFKQDNKISGSMMIVRPGKFRWEITQPNKQLIIINKNQLSIYDIDLEQMTKRKMNYNKPGNRNPAMLLSGDTQVLKSTFKIVKLKKSILDKDVWFELTPKKGDYQKVQIHFIAGKLVAMNIVDNLEQKSAINFSNIHLNTEINPDKFILTTPSDVDVINEN